jgi:hypothetical protein
MVKLIFVFHTCLTIILTFIFKPKSPECFNLHQRSAKLCGYALDVRYLGNIRMQETTRIGAVARAQRALDMESRLFSFLDMDRSSILKKPKNFKLETTRAASGIYRIQHENNSLVNLPYEGTTGVLRATRSPKENHANFIHELPPHLLTACHILKR